MLSVLVCLVTGEEISSPTLIQLLDFLKVWALQSERICQHTWVVSDELDFSSFHTSQSSLFLMARLYDKLNNKDHNQDKEHKCKPWSAYSWHITCIQAPCPRFKQGLSGFLANPYQCPGHPRSQQSILFVRLYHDFYHLVSCQVSTIVFRGIGIPVILFNENGLDDVKLPTWPSKQLRT